MVSALHYFRATDDIDPKNAVRREAPPWSGSSGFSRQKHEEESSNV